MNTFTLGNVIFKIFYKHVKVKCSNNITNRTNQCVQECLDDKRLFAIVFTLPVIFMHMNDEKPFMKGLTEGRLIFFFFFVLHSSYRN